LIDARECANQLMDTVPLIMRTLRQEIRSLRPGEFSVPQFRVLAFLRRNEGATLSDVAQHIGLMRPTMSKMVDGLVRRGWVRRDISPRDRRYVYLQLTEQGLAAINTARTETREKLAAILKSLSREDQAVVRQALKILQSVFTLETMAQTGDEDH
jgi:DNA-binding MarR family transcriptional regulator